MLSRVFVTGDDIRNVKCTQCWNYLSISPVVIRSNEPICGRCVKEPNSNLQDRAYFYEELAKFMFFPCRNDIYGCPVKSPWGKVLEHEVNCEYQPIICPAIECESEIGKEEIIHHFEAEHQHLIIKQNKLSLAHFTLNSRSQASNKLFLWKNHLFIFQTWAISSGNIFFRMSNFKGPTPKTLKIIFNSKLSSTCFNQFTIMKYDSKFPEFFHTERINIDALKNVLGSEVTCMFKFDEELNCDMDNTQLLSEIECPICTDYMRPPIYMCPTGHSICGKCRVKLSKCPSCLKPFNATRNYTLERITEVNIYPCRYKNHGCGFTGNVDGIAIHESVCSKSFQDEISCLANPASCKWKGQYSDIYQHIKSSHGQLFPLGSLLYIDAHGTNRQGFFKYDNKVFKLCIEWNKGQKNGLRWAVPCVKNKDEGSDKYFFYLGFVNGNRVFTISDICHRIPAAVINQNNVHFIDIPMHQIKPFIKDNMIDFQINIVKV